MKRIQLILPALLLIIAPACCKQGNKADDKFLPENITLAASLTKSMLERNDLLTSGTRVHIIDMLNDFDGSVNGTPWTSGDNYIDDEVVYSGTTVWSFTSGKLYPWTTSGAHVFRGWLTYDAKYDNLTGMAATDLFESGLTYEDGELSIPDTELNTNSPQFDMLYSENVLRDMSDTPRPTGIVPIQLNHLFSALSMYIINSSVDRVRVTAVSTSGLQNRKSAVIDFSGAPAYTTLIPAQGFVLNDFSGSDTWFATGDKYDLLTDTRNPSAMSYYIIWPQTAAEMAAARIHITYQIENDYELDGITLKNHVVSLRFPEAAVMNPGYKYQYVLTFANKRVSLLMNVLPWDYNQYEWNYEDSTISECTQLTIQGTLGEDYLQSGTDYAFKDGKPIVAKFGIKTPKGGEWSLELKGDTTDNIITVSPDSGTVNPDVDDGLVYITFTPDLSVNRTQDITVSLQFWVTFLNGSVKDLNSEINRDGITITLLK